MKPKIVEDKKQKLPKKPYRKYPKDFYGLSSLEKEKLLKYALKQMYDISYVHVVRFKFNHENFLVTIEKLSFRTRA